MNVIIETNVFLVSFHFPSDDLEELKKLSELAREAEKDGLITQLASSWSFARTHAVVAGLLKHADFTPDQANGIVNAALTNDQVRWIAADEDVRELLKRVVFANHQQIESSALPEIQALLDEAAEESDSMADEDLPF